MRSIVYVSLFVACTLVRYYWCILMLTIIILVVSWCSLIGPHKSAVALFYRGYQSFGNFDSAIPIEVVWMKCYMDSLFDPNNILTKKNEGRNAPIAANQSATKSDTETIDPIASWRLAVLPSKRHDQHQKWLYRATNEQSSCHKIDVFCTMSLKHNDWSNFSALFTQLKADLKNDLTFLNFL